MPRRLHVFADGFICGGCCPACSRPCKDLQFQPRNGSHCAQRGQVTLAHQGSIPKSSALGLLCSVPGEGQLTTTRSPKQSGQRPQQKTNEIFGRMPVGRGSHDRPVVRDASENAGICRSQLVTIGVFPDFQEHSRHPPGRWSVCLGNTGRNQLPSVFLQHLRRFSESFRALLFLSHFYPKTSV